MNDEFRPPSPRLARMLQRVGQLADQETRAGRVFARAESRLTQAAERLNQSPGWLKFNGEVLRQRSGLRSAGRSLAEGALRVLSLPTSSEVGALQQQIRHLEDQVGALGSQLEVAIELLERQKVAPSPAKGAEAAGPPSSRPARPRA